MKKSEEHSLHSVIFSQLIYCKYTNHCNSPKCRTNRSFVGLIKEDSSVLGECLEEEVAGNALAVRLAEDEITCTELDEVCF